MKRLIKILGTLLILQLVSACGKFSPLNNPMLPPIGTVPFEDQYLVVDRSAIVLTGTKDGGVSVQYVGPVAPNANITAITYNNPATVVGFTLNTTGLVSAGFNGDTLNFGNFVISGLDDNKLKVCPASGEANNGNVKCNHAKIRIYSATGDVNGVFQNTTDGYYIPLSVGGLPVGVGVANAAYTQDYTIASNKNRLRVGDLTGQVTNFPMTMDFSNGGAGSYSATLIVEYVLIKQ